MARSFPTQRIPSDFGFGHELDRVAHVPEGGLTLAAQVAELRQQVSEIHEATVPRASGIVTGAEALRAFSRLPRGGR